MHNKFVVIDAKSSNPNYPIVWTGSTNWTNDQMNYDYNNVIIIQDQSLAKVYTMEFEEMWGSDSLVPGTIFNGTTGTARFGLRKLDNTPHNLKIGGKLVQSYFSPSDGTNSKIIETINTANSHIQTANLILTRTDVANAIRNKVNTLTSRCSAAIVNDTNAAGPAYLIIKSAVGDSAIKINPVRSNIFHHKYMIVDSDSPLSDPTVLTGSHNWSTAGDTKNDENTLIIHDLNIANQFYQEFGARMREFRMQAPCSYVTSIEPSKKSIPALNIYPNPAQNYFVIDVEKPTNVQVINSLGQSVLCFTANQKTAINTTTLPTGIYSVIAEGYKPTSLVICK
jgi:phosphatidylserine/phosphatidylglycerophosphate/cardiolipin synthase-like enzyme